MCYLNVDLGGYTLVLSHLTERNANLLSIRPVPAPLLGKGGGGGGMLSRVSSIKGRAGPSIL